MYSFEPEAIGKTLERLELKLREQIPVDAAAKEGAAFRNYQMLLQGAGYIKRKLPDLEDQLEIQLVNSRNIPCEGNRTGAPAGFVFVPVFERLGVKDNSPFQEFIAQSAREMWILLGAQYAAAGQAGIRDDSARHTTNLYATGMIGKLKTREEYGLAGGQFAAALDSYLRDPKAPKYQLTKPAIFQGSQKDYELQKRVERAGGYVFGPALQTTCRVFGSKLGITTIPGKK